MYTLTFYKHLVKYVLPCLSGVKEGEEVINLTHLGSTSRFLKPPFWLVLSATFSTHRCCLYVGPHRLRLLYFSCFFTNSDVAQLEKSVCMGAMLWSKAAYWESPVLASLSCCAAWESWKAASGWAESGSRVHSLSSRSATPFRSSQKPKAKAAFRSRFSSWSIQIQNSNLNYEKHRSSSS